MRPSFCQASLGSAGGVGFRFKRLFAVGKVLRDEEIAAGALILASTGVDAAPSCLVTGAILLIATLGWFPSISRTSEFLDVSIFD